MSLFTIADLHLSTADGSKSMEVFGKRWNNYINRISENWRRVVCDNDTVIIPGDISWALTTNDALSDLKWLDALPGRKIVLKGNHDFWWTTVSKLNNFFKDNNISSIDILNNNAIEVENYVVAGTRGWFTDLSMQNTDENVDYNKIINRERIRLSMSLDEAIRINEATGKEIIVFLHFPVIWGEFKCIPIFETLKKYGVKKCFFGHIHGCYTQGDSFEYDGIKFTLISADYLDFLPKIV